MEGPSTPRVTLLAVCVIGVFGVYALEAEAQRAPRVLSNCSNPPSYNFDDDGWSMKGKQKDRLQLRSNAPPNTETFNLYLDQNFPDGFDLILACGLHGTGQLMNDTQPFDVQFSINDHIIEPRGSGCTTAVNTSTGWFSTIFIKGADPSYYGEFKCLASPHNRRRKRARTTWLSHSRPANTEFYPGKPQRLYVTPYNEPLPVTCHSKQDITEFYVECMAGMRKKESLTHDVRSHYCTRNTTDDQWRRAGRNVRQFVFRPTDIHTSGNWYCFTFPNSDRYFEMAYAYFKIQFEERPPTLTTIRTEQFGNKITVECRPQNTTYPHPQMHLEWYWQGERMGKVSGPATEAAGRRLTKTFGVDFTNNQGRPGYLSAGTEVRCVAENSLGTASSTLSFQPDTSLNRTGEVWELKRCQNRPHFDYNYLGRWPEWIEIRTNVDRKNYSFAFGDDIILACGLHSPYHRDLDTAPRVEWSLDGTLIDPVHRRCSTMERTRSGWVSTIYIHKAGLLDRYTKRANAVHGVYSCNTTVPQSGPMVATTKLSMAESGYYFTGEPYSLYVVNYGEAAGASCHTKSSTQGVICLAYKLDDNRQRFSGSSNWGNRCDAAVSGTMDYWHYDSSHRMYTFGAVDYTAGFWQCQFLHNSRQVFPRVNYGAAAYIDWELVIREQPPTYTSIAMEPYTASRARQAQDAGPIIYIPSEDDGTVVNVSCVPENITYPHPELTLEWYWQGQRRGRITEVPHPESETHIRRIMMTFRVAFSHSQWTAVEPTQPQNLLSGMEFRCTAANHHGSATKLTRVEIDQCVTGGNCQPPFVCANTGSGGVSCVCPLGHTGAETSCVRARCEQLDVDNANETSTGHHYQDTVTITCHHSYAMSDGSKTVDLSCGAAGSWNRPVPHCSKMQCNELESPPYRTQNTTLRAVGTVVKLGCESGFLMSTGSGFEVVTCGLDGAWRGGDTACMPLCNASAYTVANGRLQASEGDHTQLINGSVFAREYQVTCDQSFQLSTSDYPTECFYHERTGLSTFTEIPPCTPSPTTAPTQSPTTAPPPPVLGQNGQHLCNHAPHTVENGRFKPVGERRTINGSVWSERFRVVCNGGYRVSKGRYRKTCRGPDFPDVPTCQPFTCKVNASEFSQSVKKSLCLNEWSVGGQFRGRNSTHFRVDVQYVCSAIRPARQHLLQLGPLPENIEGCVKVNRQKKKLAIRILGNWPCSLWECADQMIQNKNYFMSGLVRTTPSNATELVMSLDHFVLRWCNRNAIKNIALSTEC